MALEAVRLFAERAAAALPAFTLTDPNAAAVAQLCRRLDGIPLALELAATRVKVLSPEQMAARLDDCFSLLTGGSRTALPRHQTLRATIDWSHDLLSEPERMLFRRLAVFADGFTLVGVEVRGQAARYRLLETVREYARTAAPSGRVSLGAQPPPRLFPAPGRGDGAAQKDRLQCVVRGRARCADYGKTGAGK